MKRYAQYVTENTKQNVEGCYGLVVCQHYALCKFLAGFFIDEGWELQASKMILHKEGHASIRLIAGKSVDVIWRSVHGLRLNHAFLIDGDYDLVEPLMFRLVSDVGKVDKGVHVLGRQGIRVLSIEHRQF